MRVPSLFAAVLLLLAVDFTPGEKAALGRDEVVVRRQPAVEGEGQDSFVAYVEIAAPSEKVMGAMLAFEDLGYRSSLTREVSRYREETLPDGCTLYGIRYRVSVLGVEIVYHVMHRYDPAAGRLTWHLDPDRANSLAIVDGTFEVVPTESPGRVLAVYESRIDLGKHIPASLDRYLRGKQLVGHLKAIRDIAVGGG